MVPQVDRLKVEGFQGQITLQVNRPKAEDCQITSAFSLQPKYLSSYTKCKIFLAYMKDYYQKKYKSYHEKTFEIDPSDFLSPLAERLTAGAVVLDVGCGSGRDLLGLGSHLVQ